MNGAIVLFGFTLAGAVFAVTTKNILHAIFGLAIALLGVAGSFLLLNSPFVATMEILIYIGGISIAMIFAVMLSTVVPRKTSEGVGRRIAGGMAAIGFFVAVALAATSEDFGDPTPTGSVDVRDFSVTTLGRSLLNEYNLVFEALSVILLLAIIGAITIARKTRLQRDTGLASDRDSQPDSEDLQ